MGEHFIWPQEMADALPDLVERKLTPVQIRIELEAQFGVTISRNSLAGKLHRLKLKAQTDGRSVKRSHGIAPPWGGIPVVAAQPEGDGDSYAHFRWTCRYPMNDDMRAPIWCGAVRRKNSPYCPEHHILCHKIESQKVQHDAE